MSRVTKMRDIWKRDPYLATNLTTTSQRQESRRPRPAALSCKIPVSCSDRNVGYEALEEKLSASG